jgi:hypothetical protein
MTPPYPHLAPSRPRERGRRDRPERQRRGPRVGRAHGLEPSAAGPVGSRRTPEAGCPTSCPQPRRVHMREAVHAEPAREAAPWVLGRRAHAGQRGGWLGGTAAKFLRRRQRHVTGPCIGCLWFLCWVLRRNGVWAAAQRRRGRPRRRRLPQLQTAPCSGGPGCMGGGGGRGSLSKV